MNHFPDLVLACAMRYQVVHRQRVEKIKENIELTELKIGWKEWVSLPDLQVPAIKAKVDTGARTSALHASRITVFTKPSGPWVRYLVRPLRKHPEIEIECESKLIDKRDIKNSGGQVESRYVIETTVVLGEAMWSATLSLTSRDDMLFRMLLGRTSLPENVVIYPSEKYLTGKVRLKKCYPVLRKR
jgi:ribosomal protein S6--L-glutamate ligase